ncbi:TIR domain-containing protein [Microcoleus sp. SVA1_A1]|uniref:TIR domain-containing protein n=1 Tax=Microcoleus sp. SVA1_A1 TaxID=2818946 RepID=UPI002FD32806
MLSPEQFDVFLCHNSQEKAEVEKIRDQLKQQDIYAWLDKYDFEPFRPWQVQLEEIIPQIKAAAIFIGSSGVGPWANIEMREFLNEFAERKIRMGLVILPNCPQKLIEDVPRFMRSFHWVDFRQSKPDPIDQLVWGITGKNPSLMQINSYIIPCLENSANNSQQPKHNIKKIDLAKINFRAARGQIDPRCEELKNNGGVLSLIVEKSHNYMGDLLIEEVRDRFKNGKPNFKSVLIDPESGGWSDNQGLLINIAQELNIAIEGINLTPEYLIEEIAQKCCPGRTFFFELLNWDVLGEGYQEDMLRWFYSCFWNSLIIRRLQIETRAKKVRFISTVNSRDSLNIEDFFDLNCSEFIKVDACLWQEEEIDSWLTEYGQFPSNNELGGEVKMIMKRSEGIPLSVYNLLLRRFCFI